MKENILQIWGKRLYFECCPPSPPHFLSLSSHILLLCIPKSLRSTSCLSQGNPGITRGTILVPEACCSQLPQKASYSPPLFAFPQILVPFWGRGWGSNDGRYSSLSWELKDIYTSTHSVFLICPFSNWGLFFVHWLFTFFCLLSCLLKYNETNRQSQITHSMYPLSLLKSLQ